MVLVVKGNNSIYFDKNVSTSGGDSGKLGEQIKLRS